MNSLSIADIRINGGTQSRASIDRLVVSDYADAMAAGATFPPVVVFHDGANYWLADGFHRYEAYARAKINEVPADVRQGTQRDAILFSVGANASHGLRRTNDDKRRAVLTLLNDKEWAKWSDREIARACGVGHQMVSPLRANVTGRATSERTYTTKHGTQAEMNTANIGGKSKPDQDAPAPETRAEPVQRVDLRIVESKPDQEMGVSGVDPERRKLAKLTPDAMIDEILALRADLTDAKAKVKEQAAEIRALKEEVKGFEGDQAETIRRQAAIIRHKESEMYRANDTADRALARAKKLERRVAELEKMGIAI